MEYCGINFISGLCPVNNMELKINIMIVKLNSLLSHVRYITGERR
jgi:hypothetical protein